MAIQTNSNLRYKQAEIAPEPHWNVPLTTRLLKRAFDLVFATVSIVWVAPVMAIIAVLIRLETPGPVFFKQQRVGRNGKLFSLYKFRTMHVADVRQDSFVDEVTRRPVSDIATPAWSLCADPRLTKVGRFLRRTALDELPQFFNVVAGDMSLVGPRPVLPFEIERYSHEQVRRFVCRPGITGCWQVYGMSRDRSLESMLRMDLEYVAHVSFLRDIKIIAATVVRGFLGQRY